MKGVFEFSPETIFTKRVEVEDLGNSCLRCSTGNLVAEYYICSQTSFGKTLILKFGPVNADLGLIFDSFTLDCRKLDYKETKISAEFQKFISDPKKEIEIVSEITLEELLEMIPKGLDFKLDD